MKLTQLLATALSLLTLSLLFGDPAFAQAPTCRLSVSVRDKNGAPVEGAKVVLRKKTPTGHSILPPSMTEAEEVVFDGLRPGSHTLIVTKAGYKRTIHYEYLQCIQPDDPQSTNVVLERGSPRRTVTYHVSRVVERTQIVPDPESSPGSPVVLTDVSLPQEDYGVDIAAVIVDEDFLVEEPGSSTIVLQVAGRDLLALVNRTPPVPAPKEEWYRVIHVNSGVEGWIRGDAIKIKYSELNKSTPLFREERAKTNRNPRVDISNDSNVDLTLSMRGKMYVVEAHSKRILYLRPGTYRYYGFAPGVMPAFGEQHFKAGHTYTWQFSAVGKTG